MTGRDRTVEFMATISSKRDKPQWIQQRPTKLNENTNNKLSVDPRYREFMKVSQSCAQRIRNSYEKLEQFTHLAKQRSVFDEGELNRLISEIRADISESKMQLDSLQSNYELNHKHSANVVTTLQERLVNVTNNFKSTLETRSKWIQQRAARHEIYAGPSTSTMSSYPPQPTEIPSNHNHHQPAQFQQQLLMNDQIDMQERADKVQMMESTIVELGAVFNQLATMVQTQGETITRIDMNISETAGNVESAHDALLRYFASINSNRWLMLKVFGVLFVFFVIFVMFAT